MKLNDSYKGFSEMKFDNNIFKMPYSKYIIWLSTIAMFIAIGFYSYLGTFSYYLADDYCEAVRVGRSSPLAAVMERYTVEGWPRASMRYSNLLFVGFSELLGGKNMQITMPSMIILWVIGLIWLIHEVRRFLKIEFSIQNDLLLGATAAFFSLLQAPSLFQSVYWRSAMMTHFAPLVFGSLLVAFITKQMRVAENRSIFFPIYIFILISTFIIAGFSEPPTTTIITALPLLMIWIFFRRNDQLLSKSRQIALLAWAFAGAVLGLVAMISSPAISNVRQENHPVGIFKILIDSFLYSYFFIVDSFKTQPLPIFISMLIPLILIWLYLQTTDLELHKNKYLLWGIMIAAPFLAWILIAAGFSPSVYGQGFPVERMRFLARFIMISTFMLEGAFFGLLFKKIRFKNHAVILWSMSILFVVLAIVYPIRVAINIYRFDVPEYSARAQAWDRRDAHIYELHARGQTELTVPQFDGIYDVKELDSLPEHWVNRCAAAYYGVNSIRAIPIHGDEAKEEYYNNFGGYDQ